MLRSILILVLISFSLVAFSQVEVCNNGIDDDFDGFIDCYDGSCSSSALCDGIFLGNDATCQTPPPAFPAFTMTKDFYTPDESTNHLARMVIGDLDRDGIPEMVTMNRYAKTLSILNGSDGTIQKQITVAWEPYWEIAIANLDNDNCAEIFFIGYQDPPGPNNAGIFIFAYDCTLTKIWETAEKLPGDPINFGIADFDGDGKEEIYAKDEIYDAKTGIRIVKSTAANYSEINGGPVAVNITGDIKQELVIGLAIYTVNLGTRAKDVGSLTLVKTPFVPFSAVALNYFIRDVYNATSIADYNLDGFLDVLASGSTTGNDINTTVFFWDVQNNALKTFGEFFNDASSYDKGWKNGTGRLNVSDLDGDGKMNVSYVSGKYLYALKEDFTKLWRVTINEETSGYTGCTLFDFNGDGKAEIVYRDERYIYIIEGADGSIYSQLNCSSRTNREYPIVADVDADGSTEICVTCAVTDITDANFNDFVTNNASLKYPGHIRVFKSAAEPWVPARRVWNQHGYFVVNVNDDLTIPTTIQAHQLIFSTGSCTAGPNRPLNKFLNQSPFLNSEGCPTYAAPDIAFSVAPTIIPPTCPNLNFLVSFVITNLGDVSITGDIPITFYTTNPKGTSWVKLNTITATVNKLKKGDVFAIVNATVTGVGADSVYVVLNDAGTSIPNKPIKLPNTTFFECDYDNIIGRKVIPLPVSLTALAVTPNESCSGANTGSARAFIPIGGGGENTADYNFYWSNGAVAKPIASADFVGPIYSSIGSGTYTVYAKHKTANCNSDTVQVVINSATSPLPNVTVNALANQTSCVPANGQLQAVITGGSAGFTIDWYDVALNPLGISGPTASNLAAGSYLVIITKGSCNKSSAPVTITGPLIPDAQGQVLLNVSDCINPNSGSVQADALFNGVTQNPTNYSFDWYYFNTGTNTQGSILPPANGVGQTRTSLAVGSYQAVVKDNATGCTATATPISITSNIVIPTAQITQLSPQTSCNPLTPNGILQGDALVGGIVQDPASFTFQWFKGQNTLPANLVTTVSGVNGKVVNNVAGGGIPYTLKVTNTLNCSATIDFTIAETLVNPVVTLTPTNNQICNPALASGTFTGSVAAAVTYGGVPVVDFTNYSFAWHDGSLATDPAPSPNSTTNSLTQQDGGQYTLVVTRTDLACVSNPVTSTINNTNTLPVLTTGSTSSTNCVPASVNGVARVLTVNGTAVGALANHTYQWHTGIGTGSPIAVGTNPTATSATLSNVQGGAANNFTALVTNTVNGCQTTGTVLVADAKVLPIVALAATDNGICDPSLTVPAKTFSGKVTASITNQIGALTDYTFAFAGGMGAGVQTANVFDQLNGGATAYTSIATHTLTGCVSSQVSIQVANNQVLPAITISQTSAQNCAGGAATADGIARVTNVVPNGQNYTYKWFDGNSTSGTTGPVTLNSLLTTNNYANVQGGVNGASLFEYTVEVTILQTGCANTATVGVDNDSQLPAVSLLAPTNNTNCSATKNGAAALSALSYRGNPVASPYTGFTFTWSAGGTVGPAPGNTYTALPAGAYTLTVTNTGDLCTSNPVPITVVDNLFKPPIDIVDVDQTSCDIAAPNGSLTATIDETTLPGVPGITAGYAFTWVNNVTTATTAANLITGQKGNQNYTITAVRTSTGCSSSQTVFLNETLTLPTVALAVTNMTACNPFNGKLVATPAPGAIGAYNYFWFDGSNAASEDAVIAVNNLGLVGTVTANTYDNLVPGDYTIVVRDQTTKCKSLQVVRSIIDNSPAINPVAENTAIPSLCTLNDGTLTGAVRLKTLTNFSGLNAGDQLIIGASIGLAVNDKIVISRNGILPLPAGLLDDQTYFVESLAGVGTVITLKDSGGTHITLTSNGDGTIADFVTAGYTFDWYNSAPAGTLQTDPINYYTNPPNFTLLTASGANPNSIYANIGTGLYSLEVTDNATGCKNFISHTLPFVGAHAVLNISKTNSLVCSPPGVDNGSITIEIEDPAGPPPVPDNYTVTLTQGASTLATFNPVAPLVPLTVSNALTPGTYVIVVRQNYGSLCPISQDVIIGRDAHAPVITLTGPITSNTACDPLVFNGRIDFNVNKDAGDLTVGTTYDIDMVLDPNGSFPLLAQPVGNQSALNLAPGNYTFTVTASTGCTSTKAFTVIDNPVVSQFTSANITIGDAEYCTPALEQSAKVIVNQLGIIGGGAENLADYNFVWRELVGNTIVHSALGSASNIAGGDELINQVPAVVNGTVAAATVVVGSYSVVATKTADASLTGGLGCSSAPYIVNIANKKINPQITLTPAGDTSCNPAVFEGSIEVDVATASGPGAVVGALYDYTWVPTAAAGRPSNSVGNTGANNVLPNINDGTYTLTAQNQLTGCVSTLSTTIIRDSPPLFTLTASAIDLTSCGSFDGSITLNQVFENSGGGPVAANTADFDYVWYQNDPSTISVLDGTVIGADMLLDIVSYPAITLDKYFVKAVRKAGGAGIGCISPAMRKDILDARIFPQTSFTTQASTSCDTNFDGQISVTATTTGFPNTTNYNFDWTGNPVGSTITDLVVQSPYNYQVGDIVGPGTYLIAVTNQTNSCVTTGTVSLLSNPLPINILTASAIDQLICYADGSATVNSLSLGVPADYTFAWFRSVSTGTALVDGSNTAIISSLLDKNNYASMGADVYFVTATRNASRVPGSGCKTPPFLVQVKDKHVNPVIQFTSASNSSCNNLLPNGTILANATEQNGITTNSYSFNWTLNGLALPGVTTTTNTTNSSQLTNSKEGSYVLTAVNTSTTGCAVSSNLNLLLDQTKSTPNIVDIDWIDPIDCNPSVVATVTKITLGSTTNSLLFPPNVTPNNEITGPGLLNFDYEWYQGSYNPTNQLPIGGPFTTTPVITSLLSGNYFVVVHDPITDCKSGPKEVLIKSDNIIYPVLEVTQTKRQVSCIAVTGTAALAAIADGQSDANLNYDFTWFNNFTNSLPAFATTSTIQNLLQGEYSVMVLDKTTSCKASAPYIIKDDSKEFTPVVSVGGQPRTLCVGIDGSILARVANLDPTYPFPYDANTFTASLFFGATPNLSGVPEIPSMPFVTGFFTSVLQGGLNAGAYTVRITDNNSGCVGVATHLVEDARRYPALEISEVAPITNCDPVRPNGVARVLADGIFDGFQFDWYEGASVAGSPIYTGAEYGELKPSPQQYTIRGTDLLSGCTKDIQTSFKDGTVPIPVPTIEKLSDVTSCVISNGALSAYVGADKNTKDYILSWYDGTTENPPADLIGEIYTDLAAGKYSVTATSKITGCKSPVRTEEVKLDQKFPDFTFVIQNTTCEKNDGFASLIMLSNTPVERIEWSNDVGPFLTGPNFSDAAYGTYTVTATTFLGCSATKDLEIKPDIRPYNGISRNNDGQNEFFMIDCIQEFPNNIVKIFNRAGTLVYEAQGYDNSSTFFDGKSNKGISPMGVDLPDGTYYYIVDKREGSKPIAGYLEIVN